MGIELFLHNQKAYLAVLDMLSDTGKAAVIHPTGTGKTFIAFKLCEYFSDKKVCWLSPSEYIFKTQLENLKKATDGYQPTNIQFYTYAKLCLLSCKELEMLQPDLIILDEFHRCGAPKWGDSVNFLLGLYPNVNVVGLSATNVRYLDNQRDMALELFAGNIASEMSLGEAIVRGIIKPPKYILATFQYKNYLEKYEKRVKDMKNQSARDNAGMLLEDLRRALDKATGLDDIFFRHMDNPYGKYIVFCANYVHMQEMIALAPSWFHKVDGEAHIYSAYSEDPSTDESFSAFKVDSSRHLKLLYCIDMLNEGIHVDNVDGVILLRPTVSPIVYKQQIGRALSVNNIKRTVVFDIVLNIDNLYSIGAVEEEMEQALFLYRYREEEDAIVNEEFHIIDEVRDCMELFDKLNDVLTASWNTMYSIAKRYYEEHGHLEVPRKYTTKEGYALGAWISTQRRVYSGKSFGILTNQQVRQLSEIGMRWGDRVSSMWNVYYQALCEYRREYGNLDILARYQTPDGLSLGSFVTNLRTSRANGIKNSYLTPARIAALDELGMIWDKIDYKWEANYLACSEYYSAHQSLNIPADYVSKDGLKIGSWIRRQKRRYAGLDRGAPLSNLQKERLEAIGIVWDDDYTSRWEKGYVRACAFFQTHGHLNVPTTYVDETGFALGKWIKRHKAYRSDGTTQTKVTPERRAKLDSIGMVWE